MNSKIPEFMMWMLGIVVCVYLILFTSDPYDHYIGFAGLIYLMTR